jgi:DNA invertase Pin-like site-specific DNA recombinase
VKRAAIYARVSTAEQVEGTSLTVQVDRCEHYIAAQTWAPVASYVDEGVSGAKASRPALDRLMREVRAGTVDVVVIAKLDRIGRSMRHLGAVLGELDDRKVALVSVTEAFDSSTASGRLQRNMLGSFAEFEREVIRDRMVSGRDAVVRAGKWATTMCPYGYRAGPPDYKLEINPTEGDAVWVMVDLFVNQRMNTAEVARQLNAAGYQPRRASRWTTAAVRQVLRDGEHLAGNFTWRRADRHYDGPPIPVVGPALIDPATLQRLRDRLAATANKHTTHPERYLLAGRIHGPHGTPMYGYTSRAALYRCAETFPSTYSADGRCQTCRTVRAEHVETAVWAEVAALLADTDRLLAMAGLHLDAHTSRYAANDDDLAALDRKIGRLETAAGDQISRLLADGLDPVIATHAVRNLTEQLAVARTRRQRLVEWQAVNADHHNRTARLLEIADHARHTLPTADRHTKARVIALLDITVTITGWERCPTCNGTGWKPSDWTRPKKYEVRPKMKPTVCPECQRHRWLPRLVIEGTVPEADLDTTTPPDQTERWPFKVVARTG